MVDLPEGGGGRESREEKEREILRKGMRERALPAIRKIKYKVKGFVKTSRILISPANQRLLLDDVMANQSNFRT